MWVKIRLKLTRKGSQAHSGRELVGVAGRQVGKDNPLSVFVGVRTEWYGKSLPEKQNQGHRRHNCADGEDVEQEISFLRLSLGVRWIGFLFL